MFLRIEKKGKHPTYFTMPVLTLVPNPVQDISKKETSSPVCCIMHRYRNPQGNNPAHLELFWEGVQYCLIHRK